MALQYSWSLFRLSELPYTEVGHDIASMETETRAHRDFSRYICKVSSDSEAGNPSDNEESDDEDDEEPGSEEEVSADEDEESESEEEASAGEEEESRGEEEEELSNREGDSDYDVPSGWTRSYDGSQWVYKNEELGTEVKCGRQLKEEEIERGEAAIPSPEGSDDFYSDEDEAESSKRQRQNSSDSDS